MSTPSKHEPECPQSLCEFDNCDMCNCDCEGYRSAYQRGREDAYNIAFKMLHRPTTGEEPRTIILEDLFLALKENREYTTEA